MELSRERNSYIIFRVSDEDTAGINIAVIEFNQLILSMNSGIEVISKVENGDYISLHLKAVCFTINPDKHSVLKDWYYGDDEDFCFANIEPNEYIGLFDESHFDFANLIVYKNNSFEIRVEDSDYTILFAVERFKLNDIMYE